MDGNRAKNLEIGQENLVIVQEKVVTDPRSKFGQKWQKSGLSPKNSAQSSTQTNLVKQIL